MASYVLSLSYGKDSMACLGAIEKLGWPLDRIVNAEVWATDTIHAEHPTVIEFKEQADRIIKDRWGIQVEHVSLYKNGEHITFEKLFYTKNSEGNIYGWPRIKGGWCRQLKLRSLPLSKGDISYVGIAADEPERIARNTKPNTKLPLVELGWDEAYCRKWCEENNLLSPIYETENRSGCWFCPNQTLDSLRRLRNSRPDLWELMLKWDLDSEEYFRIIGTRNVGRGITIHDYEYRFSQEDDGVISVNDPFRWDRLYDPLVKLAEEYRHSRQATDGKVVEGDA